MWKGTPLTSCSYSVLKLFHHVKNFLIEKNYYERGIKVSEFLMEVANLKRLNSIISLKN